MTTGPRHGWQFLHAVPPLGSGAHSFLLQVSRGCLLVCLLHETRRSGAVLGSRSPAFPYVPGPVPKPQRKQARVNTEENKGQAKAQLCGFTAELMSTPSYISASPTPLSSHWSKAGFFLLCAIYNLCFGREHARVPQPCYNR